MHDPSIPLISTFGQLAQPNFMVDFNKSDHNSSAKPARKLVDPAIRRVTANSNIPGSPTSAKSRRGVTSIQGLDLSIGSGQFSPQLVSNRDRSKSIISTMPVLLNNEQSQARLDELVEKTVKSLESIAE